MSLNWQDPYLLINHEFNEAWSLDIVGVDGRIHFSKQFSSIENKVVENISDLNTGVYFIRIQTEQGKLANEKIYKAR